MRFPQCFSHRYHLAQGNYGWASLGGCWCLVLGGLQDLGQIWNPCRIVPEVLVMPRCPRDATSWRWWGEMGTGLLAFCCSKCQCKLGKTCFLKKISTLTRKEMPWWFWKHIRCFLVWSTMCTANARHFLWRADIFHNNNIFLFLFFFLSSVLPIKKKWKKNLKADSFWLPGSCAWALQQWAGMEHSSGGEPGGGTVRWLVPVPGSC